MRIAKIILLGFILFLVGLTFYFWRKHQRMKRIRKRRSKFEMLEVSELDQRYSEYYEPQIVEVVSSEEYL